MDASKMIAALVALPEGSERKLGGLFQVTLRKGLRKLPPLYAIPTTAGTGSETTIVAVVSDPKTHAKYTWALFLYAAWQICYTECTRMINHEGAII